jgi:glutamate racemase
LLLDRLERLAPWPVAWIDPAPAIARRVVDLIGPPQGSARTEPAEGHFTSGRVPAALAKALSALGIKAVADASAI